MTKYLTLFSLILLLTSCAFSSEKSKKTEESAIKADEFEHVENSITNKSETDPEGEENEMSHTNYEDQEPESDDMAGFKEIHFTELWIWEYLSEDREWKEMWVYREPNLNYWLFERLTSFGETSAMCEWVVAKPNGAYFLSYQEPEMNTPNSLEKQVVQFDDEDDFPEFWKPTGKIKEFGEPEHGWKNFEGEKHEVFFKGQPDPSLFYLGTSDIDMRTLYHFNNLEGDIELPISFPLGVPKNTLVLSEETDFEYYNKKVNYRFKNISPNSYYVYLPEE